MAPLSEMRELLFGDVALERWSASGKGEPWSSLQEAASAIRAGDNSSAERALRGILAQRSLESRQYLQAWHALRSIGVQPSAGESQHLYGLILDVPMGSGWDTLAAYEDHSCRYLNYTGAATIWERPSGILDQPIERFLAAGRATVVQIGPWDGPRPALTPDKVRISFLCPVGLHFGEAAFETLMQDPKASDIINSGTALLQAVTGLAAASK